MSVIRPIATLYLEMSVVFGLFICTATVNSCTVGNESVLFGFFFGGGGGGGILIRECSANKCKEDEISV